MRTAFTYDKKTKEILSIIPVSLAPNEPVIANPNVGVNIYESDEPIYKTEDGETVFNENAKIQLLRR